MNHKNLCRIYGEEGQGQGEHSIVAELIPINLRWVSASRVNSPSRSSTGTICSR